MSACAADGDPVAGAEAELLGGSCRTPFEEHGVYETTIVYSIDEQVVGPLFPPMDADRNTLEYRTRAYGFLNERYGLNIDPNDPNDQFIADGLGGTALVRPIKGGEGSTHQVYGIDAQNMPGRYRGRFPVTNVAFHDDGFFVFVITDFQVGGTYAAEFGTGGTAIVRGGDLLVAGEYVMVDEDEEVIDAIRYFADTPALTTPFTGLASTSNGHIFVSITCRVESDLFGTGLTRGIGEIHPLGGDVTDLDFRYIMRFPSRLSETDVSRPNCRNF